MSNSILALFGAIIGGYIVAKYNDIQSIPEIKKSVTEFQTDQAENNKMYNGMLYNLNEWKKRTQIEDSIMNSKH